MNAEGAVVAKDAWRELAHGSRDLFEILYACDVLVGEHSGHLRQVLPTLLSGAWTPDDDASSAARNLQFETMLAAQFIAGGLTVAFAEPDFVFGLDGERYGVAAKRISSAKQIAKNVTDGTRQLRRAGLRGFVAVNLDGFAQPPGTWLQVPAPDPDLEEAAQRALATTLREHGQAIREAARRSSSVLGVCISVTIVGFVRHPWAPAFTTAQRWQEETPLFGPILTKRVPDPKLIDADPVRAY
jgi:hypothetical protein